MILDRAQDSRVVLLDRIADVVEVVPRLVADVQVQLRTGGSRE